MTIQQTGRGTRRDGTMDVLVVAESPTDRLRLCHLVAAVPGVDGLRQAASRADAVRAIEERSPDLVLWDVQLRDGIAPGLLENLRGATAPGVLALTDDPTESVRRQCMAAGAERLLPKSDAGAIETAMRGWNQGTGLTEMPRPATARPAGTELATRHPKGSSAGEGVITTVGHTGDSWTEVAPAR